MRHIDADALSNKLEALAKRYAEKGLIEVSKEYIWACTLVDAAPTADVAPVVHGRFDGGECKNCGWFGDCVDTPYYNYCPNCGAKMRCDNEQE